MEEKVDYDLWGDREWEENSGFVVAEAETEKESAPEVLACGVIQFPYVPSRTKKIWSPSILAVLSPRGTTGFVSFSTIPRIWKPVIVYKHPYMSLIPH